MIDVCLIEMQQQHTESREEKSLQRESITLTHSGVKGAGLLATGGHCCARDPLPSQDFLPFSGALGSLIKSNVDTSRGTPARLKERHTQAHQDFFAKILS